MPQLFQVLRCYNCLVFQVHQTKKSNKWECKLCGEKQSVKRHYGLGTAKDCRLHVQKLNAIRGEIDNISEITVDDSKEESDEPILQHEVKPLVECTQENVLKKSKWSEYVQEKEAEETIDEGEVMYLDNTEVVFDKRKAHPKVRQRKYNLKRNISKTSDTLNSVNNDYNTKKIKTDQLLITEIDMNIVSAKVPLQQDKIVTFHSNRILSDTNDMNLQLSLSKKTEEIPKKFIPPKLNSNSKWAQFVETDVDEDQKVSSMINNKQKAQTLFALSDENDLDDILDV